MLSGVATLYITDDEVDVLRGQLIQFPGHLPHRYTNRSRGTAVRGISVVVMAMK